MAGHCTHCGGSGFRNPSRERDAVERDAILLHVATSSFMRWTELTDVQRERYRQRAINYREHMATYEGVT